MTLKLEAVSSNRVIEREPPLTFLLVTANLKARSAILVRVHAG